MFEKKKIAKVAHDVGNSDYGNRFGGNGFKDFISPQGLERWKPSAGMNKINIIPYNASEFHPMVVTGQVEKGDAFYSLDIFVHKDIGPTHANIPCLTQFGKECPLCNEGRRIKATGNNDLALKFFSKRRVVYIIHDIVNNKYGYWDTGFKSVEQKINVQASCEMGENGEKIDVYDWEEGKTIRFIGTERTFNGSKYIEPDGFGFLNRPPLSDEELKHSMDLSTSLNMVSAEEMEKLLSGSVSTVSSSPVSSNVQEESSTVAELQSNVASVASQALSDENENQEAPKNNADSGEKKCPCGFAWGDADKHPECGTCQVWEHCIA